MSNKTIKIPLPTEFDHRWDNYICYLANSITLKHAVLCLQKGNFWLSTDGVNYKEKPWHCNISNSKLKFETKSAGFYNIWKDIRIATFQEFINYDHLCNVVNHCERCDKDYYGYDKPGYEDSFIKKSGHDIFPKENPNKQD